MSDSDPAAGDSAAAPRPGFVHLHLHSEYSLLDGGNRLDRLVARVKELGMDAVAVTDHGNLHAAVAFYEQARAAGIKPILGVEAYVAPGDRRDRTYTGVQDGGYHLVLLAENLAGWNNLMELCSEAYLSGFYFKPRMDREILERCNEGLIAINGHLGSELASHLLRFEETKDPQHYKNALGVARWHQKVFAPGPTGPRFYVELQSHVVEQDAINPHLIRLARELGLPLVCDNDSHFLRAEDHDAHDTLVCISTGKAKSDPARMKYTPELYVKSPGEMAELFDAPAFNNAELGDAGREALANTAAIAGRCDVELPIGANHAPVVVVKAPPADALPAHDDPAYAGDLTAWYQDLCSRITLEPANDPGLDQAELKEDCDRALRLLAEAGMVWRYGPVILEHKHAHADGAARGDAEDADAYDKWARLNRELGTLADKLISAYFLIVWDFVNWGRARGIPALARGSGVGTMAGYVLGLSNACPVAYGLLFERFTDPDRAEYPDIDIDLCQDGRGDVIDYVRRKYGHVAQIITFGTLKARAAIRDVARVLELPLAEADKLAKLVPEELKITIDKAIDQEPDLKAWIGKDDRVRRVIDNARVLEGQARHASVHAAGVIVATRPLHQVVPLYKQSGSDDVITQWDGPTCEKMGLLKMDFLGLRTLSVIERAKTLIRETLPERAIWDAVGRGAEFEKLHGGGPARSAAAPLRHSAASPHPLDLERLTSTDPNVFRLFQRGDTTGVFQFESGGMRRLLLDMKPDRLEDLIAANALFRPGPMDLIPDYNARKHGRQEVPTVHPIVDRHTAGTYGVMVYQEQVMQIVHELGDIPLRQAYTLIKAISKKKAKVIDANRPRFIEGAVAKGLNQKEADHLFELILKFAGYGFNKSHSTGYAIVAYQTAYLKTYFPNHYMAAFLSFESQAQKVADWLPYLDDCKRTSFTDPTTGETVKTGVEVRPPDINGSDADFAVVYEKDEPRAAHAGHVRFGLKAIKGAGAKAIEAIVAERDGGGAERSDDAAPAARPDAAAPSRGRPAASPKPYASLFDFAERVPPGTLNKATIEALIKAGAFDAVHGRDQRASLVASIDAAVSAGQKIAQDKAAGQNQLFGALTDDAPAADDDAEAAPLVRVPAWTEAETLRQEKDTLGFYVSSHPLEAWAPWIRVFTGLNAAELKAQPQDKRVILAALVQSTRTIVCRTGRSAGQKMGILTLEDQTGTCEAVAFAGVFGQFAHLLDPDAAPLNPEDPDAARRLAEMPKFFLGRVDHSRGDPQIIIDRVCPIDGQPVERGRLLLRVSEPKLNGSSAAALRELRGFIQEADTPPADPANAHGDDRLAAATLGALAPLDLLVETDHAWVTLEPEPKPRLRLVPGVVSRLEAILGEGSARYVGGVSVEINREITKPRQRRA